MMRFKIVNKLKAQRRKTTIHQIIHLLIKFLSFSDSAVLIFIPEPNITS